MHEFYVPPPVAEILEWQNNCALSCTSIFLINAFVANKLSEVAEERLTDLFNRYYQTSLSIEQLRDVFSTTINLPSDRQIILGPVLREFVTANGVVPEEDNMLSDEAFRPLAEAFEFNVVFYADVDREVRKSEAIPRITIDPSFGLTLCPYYHHSHYDLIVDSEESAYVHNNSAFVLSPHGLPIESGREEVLRIRVVEIIHDRYNPEQQRQFNTQIDNLRGLVNRLLASGSADRKIADKFVADLKKLSDDFFKQPVARKLATIDEFKKEAAALIKNVYPQLVKHSVFAQVLKNILLFVATLGVGYIAMGAINKINKNEFFFFHPSEEKQQLKSSLDNTKEQIDSIQIERPAGIR